MFASTIVHPLAKKPTAFGVDFMQAMSNYNVDTMTSQDPLWQKTGELYHNFIAACEDQITSSSSIPKIIHQIWLGSPFPERCKNFRDSWLKLHPDWDYMLWTEKKIKEFGLYNKKLYDTAKNYGEKSDIARYEILYRMGGLYIDTDFECLQPFDYIHEHSNFYAGLNRGPSIEVFNGMIGSCPGHPIVQLCIERLHKPELLKRRSNHPMAIIIRTGPQFFTQCIYACLDVIQDGVVLFPSSYFYAWPNSQLHLKDPAHIQKWIKPESMALHHWHCSWQK